MLIVLNTCTSITVIQQQDTCIIRKFINNSVLGTDYRDGNKIIYLFSTVLARLLSDHFS